MLSRRWGGNSTVSWRRVGGKKQKSFKLLIGRTSHAIEASREHLLIGNCMSKPIRIIINILLNVSRLQNIVSRAYTRIQKARKVRRGTRPIGIGRRRTFIVIKCSYSQSINHRLTLSLPWPSLIVPRLMVGSFLVKVQ